MGRQEEFQKINRLISRWITEIDVNNAVDFYDINRVAEDVARQLLNKIYNYNLCNLNVEKRNYPGIDLGDKKNKIAFQVTSRSDTEKIKDSLQKFKKKGAKKYSRGIRFLILQKKAPKFTEKLKEECKAIYPDFDPEKHVLTVGDLTRDILPLYDKAPDQFREILKLLVEEFADRVKGEERKRGQTDGDMKKKFNAFLSYNSLDRPLVEQIAQWLVDNAKLSVWFDKWSIRPGSPWQEEIEKALDESECCVVFFGPNGINSWQNEEMRTALDIGVSEKTLRVIPVLLPGSTRPDQESLLPRLLRRLKWVVFKHNLYEDDALYQLVWGIKGIPTNKVKTKIQTYFYPYRGLKAFQKENQRFFFGRKMVVRQLIGSLESNRFLAVLGLSGSGKSSVVQAGIIPLLEEQALVPLFTPGQHPMEELAFTLRKYYPKGKWPPVESLINRLEKAGKSLHYIAREILENTDKKNIIFVIDQFEEVFNPTTVGEERKKFIDILLNAVEVQKGPVKVILTMRSDFRGKCTPYHALNKYVGKYSFQLEPMNQKQLRSAIEKPAKLVGIEFEPGLKDRILADVKGAPGELPLLQHALLELYKQRKGTQITFQAYNNIGGVEGALVERAESEFAKLDDGQKEILRKMFVLRLIQPGEGTDDTRRRATKEELLAVGKKSHVAEDLLYQLTRAHLLTITSDTLRQEYFVEVAHEALIRKWDRIQTWMAKDRETARQIGILRHAALEWKRTDEDSGYLFQGARLFQIEALLESHANDLTETEIKFINAGIELRNRNEKEKEEAHLKELQLRQQRIIKWIIAIAAIGLLLMVVITSIQKIRADEQYELAASNRLATESTLVLPADNIKAIRIAEAAYKISSDTSPPSVQLMLSEAAYSTFERPFYNASMHHRDKVTSAIFSPDGSKILTTSMDGTLILWDLNGNHLANLTKYTDNVSNAAFSPDGAQILTISLGNTAKLWDLNGNLSAELKHTDRIWSAVFSPDGNKIITTSDDETAKLWGLSGNLLADLNKHKAYISSAVFSPDGNKIITTSWDNTAKLWDLDGKLLTDLDKHTDYVWSADVSPDGTKIITASSDNTAKLWDLRGKLLADLKHTDKVWGGIFSPDGTDILTRSGNSAKLWDLKGNLLADLNQHLDEVKSAIFSPDGTSVLTRSGNSVKLWNLNGNLLTDLNKHRDYVSGAIFSSDGSKILTLAGNTAKLWDLKNQLLVDLNKYMDDFESAAILPDGSKILTWSGKNAKLWDLKGNLIANLNKHTSDISSVAFSLDGSKILTAYSDNNAKLWDLKDNLLANLEMHKSVILDATFSPDGSKILTPSSYSTVKLWDLKRKRSVDLDKHPTQVSSAVFFPDGSKILTVSRYSTVNLWDSEGNFLADLDMNMDDVETAVLSPNGTNMLTWSGLGNTAQLWDLKGKHLANLKHKDSVNSGVFFPDSTKILTASRDNTAKLWDLEGKLLADLNLHEDNVRSAVFSPDGTKILTASDDNTAKLWDLKGNLLADLNKHTDDVWDAAFSPDGKYIITVSKDGTVKRWFTPEAIIEWLKTSPIPKLTEEEKEDLGIADFEID